MKELKNKFKMEEALGCNDSIIEASTKLVQFCNEFDIDYNALEEYLLDLGYRFVDDDYYCIILNADYRTCFLSDLEDDIFEFLTNK